MTKVKKWLAIAVPGWQQFEKGQTPAGVAWLAGTLSGYLAGGAPGLIIHGIYIGKHWSGKPSTKKRSRRSSKSVASTAAAANLNR